MAIDDLAPNAVKEADGTEDVRGSFLSEQDSIADLLKDEGVPVEPSAPVASPPAPKESEPKIEVLAQPQVKPSVVPASEPPVVEAAKPLESPEQLVPTPTPVAKEEPPEPSPPPQALEEPPETPVVTPEARLAARKTLIERVAKNYVISPEDEELLVSEPGKVLPRLIGTLYADIYEALQTVVQLEVPKVYRRHVEVERTAHTDGTEFFKRWPELKTAIESKPELIRELTEVGKMYRQLHPKASKKEFIEQVGAQTVWQLGLAQVPAAKPVPPTVSSAPTARHTPASPGSSPIAPTSKVMDDPSGFQELLDVEI